MGSPVPPVQQGCPPVVRRIVAVCGYGCDLESPLKQYLERIAAWCRQQRPDAVILCGGQTQQKTFPGLSEARVMYDYLSRSLPYVPQWFLEENSFTVRENMQYAARIVQELQQCPWPDTIPRRFEVTIWCEARRRWRVRLLAWNFLGFVPAVKTVAWERAHPIVRIAGAVRDVLIITFPLLDAMQSRYRRRIRSQRI